MTAAIAPKGNKMTRTDDRMNWQAPHGDYPSMTTDYEIRTHIIRAIADHLGYPLSEWAGIMHVIPCEMMALAWRRDPRAHKILRLIEAKERASPPAEEEYIRLAREAGYLPVSMTPQQ